MTLLSELQALAEKWRQDEKRYCGTGDLDACADELTELLGKVVVTDEMVERALVIYYAGDADQRLMPNMRAAIETILGVTK